MIRASKNSSLRPRRGDLAPIVIRQHETRGGYGFKPVPIVLARQPIRKWRIPSILLGRYWRCLAVVLAVVPAAVLVAAVLAVVPAVVPAAVPVVVLAAVLAVLYFVSYTRCDLILYVNVKPPFRFN